MSKVQSFNRFAQSLVESDDCDIFEIGEELLYFVSEWAKEVNVNLDEDETDEAGILIRPTVNLEDN